MVLCAHTAPFFAMTPLMTIAVTTVSQDAQMLLMETYGMTYMTAHLTISSAQMLQHGLNPLPYRRMWELPQLLIQITRTCLLKQRKNTAH